MPQQTLRLPAARRGLTLITETISGVVQNAGINAGLCHVFLHHTSASLVIQENADPDVQTDLEAWMSRLVQDGDALFSHTAEGPDDMSAHIKSALTNTFVTLPISDGALALGTWQGVYLWEHRDHAAPRQITVTIMAC